MKRFIISIIIIFLTAIQANSLELDLSVDEEIRRNYNPSKLELEQLLSLPENETNLQQIPENITTPTRTYTPPAQLPSQPPKTTPVIQYSNNTGKVKNGLPDTSLKNDKTALKIKKGTKFIVKSQTKVSDWNSAGAEMTFVSTQPVYSKYLTIPAGTVFRGVIEESHPPQVTGNGGLLVLKATTMQYKGTTYYIYAKITKANSKKIFFNNIKGERKYWKNVAAQVDKGEKIYLKTRKTSTKLANNPIGVIISPIPTIAGTAIYAINLAGSPLIAIPEKGSHITLPAGTIYEIKLIEPAYVH